MIVHAQDYSHRVPLILQDRYAGLTGPGSFRGGYRGGLRGLRGSGLRGGSRGGFRGGYAGGGAAAAAGRDFSDNLYADYSGPDSQGGAAGLRMDGFAAGGYGAYAGYEPEPSQQIMVRNVSLVESLGASFSPTDYHFCLAAVVDRQRGFGRAVRNHRSSRAGRDPLRGRSVEGLWCCPVRPGPRG